MSDVEGAGVRSRRPKSSSWHASPPRTAEPAQHPAPSTPATAAGPIDVRFEATLTQGGVNAPGSWTVIVMAGSAEVFGTRRPVKVAGTMDGHPFEATLLPLGDGTHIVPVKAAVRKAIGKGAGDGVTVHLQHRH